MTGAGVDRRSVSIAMDDMPAWSDVKSGERVCRIVYRTASMRPAMDSLADLLPA